MPEPSGRKANGRSVVFFANTEWYLYNFRRSLAAASRGDGLAPLLISPPGPFGERLRDACVRWQPVPMRRRSLNPIREFGLIVHLIGLLRRERPVLIHNFTIKCAVYGSIAAGITGVPIVNAVAGLGYVFVSDDLRAGLLRPLVRRLLRFALNGPNSILILQNSDDVRMFIDERLVRADRVRLIKGSGVDLDRFRPAEDRTRTKTGPFRVVVATRLLWDKGLAELAEAARILKREGRSIEIVLAGTPDPGNPASVDESTVRGWVEEGLLEWRGHVDDMPSLYCGADVVALPSYREGLPKSLIEAAACGAALVTTDVPGCREVVEHEVDGLLVPVRDARALAEALARLDDAPELRARLSAAAREKAIREFDERIVIEQTLAVYRELIGEGRRTRGRSA